MATEKFEVVHDVPMLVGESAIWHEVESALYWVDIEGLTVNRLHAASGKFSSWKMGSNPSALAIDDNNFLVVATRERLLRLNTTDGAETPIADAPYDPSKVRFNDGRVDPAGRFWIGTMYEPRDQPAAEMYVLDRDNLRLRLAGGMTNSNGLAWSLDGRTMFHADTTTHRIDCYDFDVATGEHSNRRTILTFPTDKTAPDYGGRPDGATVDAEGIYWVRDVRRRPPAAHLAKRRDAARDQTAGALPDVGLLRRARPAHAVHHQRQPRSVERRDRAVSAHRQGAVGAAGCRRPRRARVRYLNPGPHLLTRCSRPSHRSSGH